MRAFQRGLDGVLHGLVGGEPRAQQLVDALDVGLERRGVAAGYAPTNAPARREIILGKSSEGNAGNIGRNAGEGDVLFAVVENQLVVNFVGKDNEIVFAGQLGNFFQLSSRVECSRRIIGVDEHDAARPRCDLFADVVEIRLPRVVFIQIVKIERDLDLGQHGGIERIVRARREDIFAGIEQCREAKIDGFAYALCNEHTLHAGDFLARGFVADGGKSFVDSQ